jgi:hypothetical protein
MMACQNMGCAIGDKIAPAECNSIGCVRPTYAFQKLAKIAERTLSMMQVTEPPNALGLCGAGNCATDPTVSPLPENCGSAGCATPEPNDGASIHASTRVTAAFAAVTEQPMRLPTAVPWTEWAERRGFGGLYKPKNMD